MGIGEGHNIIYVINRLLSKLADASKVQGVSGAQTRSVQEVLEDANTGATQQFAAAVEFGKKFHENPRYSA